MRRKNRNYKPGKARVKAATEGGIAGAVTILAGLAAAKLTGDQDVGASTLRDPVIVGAVVTVGTGMIRWWRNRRKHRTVETFRPGR
jgi:hypothetical protein